MLAAAAKQKADTVPVEKRIVSSSDVMDVTDVPWWGYEEPAKLQTGRIPTRVEPIHKKSSYCTITRFFVHHCTAYVPLAVRRATRETTWYCAASALLKITWWSVWSGLVWSRVSLATVL